MRAARDARARVRARAAHVVEEVDAAADPALAGCGAHVERGLARPRHAVDERLVEEQILPRLGEPVRYLAPLPAALPVLIESVKAQGLEGLVAKRRSSRYEPGLRSGAWQKMRINQGQEFVIGGYTGMLLIALLILARRMRASG